MEHTNLLCGTEQKWGFTLGNSILQIMPKMPLSMKPAESISKHAIRNASTAKKGLIKWGLFLSLFMIQQNTSHSCQRKILSARYFCMTVSWPKSYLLQLFPINIQILFTGFSSLLEVSFKCFQRWAEITFCSEWGKLKSVYSTISTPGASLCLNF